MVQKIVEEVFKKANEECVSKAKTALSRHIAEEIQEKFNINISERTLLRSYDKYILDNEDIGSLTAENVDFLCMYLGFIDYLDFLSKNKIPKKEVLFEQKTLNNIKLVEKKRGEKPPTLWKKIALISFSVLIMLVFFKFYFNNLINVNTTQCMVWEKTKYIEISCNKSRPDTKVIPIDKKKMENLKKVILKRSTIIFSPKGKPLYWYNKINSKEVEFFTSSGLHPVTGKTLKAITSTIFDKYVPIHTNIENSFVNP